MMRAAESYETEAPRRHQYVQAGPDDDDGAERQIVKAGPYHDDTEPSRRKVVYAGSDENESLTRPSDSRSTRVNDLMSTTRSTQASALSSTAPLATADTPSSLVLPAKSDAHPASAGNFGAFRQLDYMQQTPHALSTSGLDGNRGLFPISIPPEKDASLAIADRTAVEQAQHSKKGENPPIHKPPAPKLPLDAPRSLSVAESSLDAEYALPVYPDSFEEIDIHPQGDNDDEHGWQYFPCEFCQRKVRGGRACRCPQVMRRHGFLPPL